MAGIEVDDRAFQAGLVVAVRELRDQDGAGFLRELGRAVVSDARRRAPVLKQPDPRRRPGELRDSIEARPGQDQQGPFVDVGTWLAEYPFYVEFGTIHARGQPFMRPALAMLRGGLARFGVKAVRSSTPRARLIAKRAGKRGIIRVARRRGRITTAEARTLSRRVGSRFQFRSRRRR